MSASVFTAGRGEPVEQWEIDRAQAKIKRPPVDPRRVAQIAEQLKATDTTYDLLD